MHATETGGGSRTERKKKKTKEQIVAAAMQLFREHGFEATTMEQIAREADVAKGTLYNHFPVKEAILDEYIRGAFKEKNTVRIRQLRGMPDTRSRMVFILGQLIAGVQAQKEIFDKYLSYRIRSVVSLRPDEAAKSGIGLLAAEIVELGQRSGEIRDDLPRGMLLDLFEFVFVEVAKLFYQAPEEFRAREAIDQGVDLYMSAVEPRVTGDQN